MHLPQYSLVTNSAVALTIAASLLTSHAQAQTPTSAYPSKPIRLVVPFPAGGATDIIGRVLAQKLSVSLGQNVVVENKPGAGGVIGSDFVAKAANDGYTLLLATSSTHSIGPALNPKIPYDANKDFAPIAHIANAPSVLVVGASSPVKSAKELVDTLKANPGKLNYGSSGIGTYPHLSAEMFKWRAGNLFAVHIPYRGTGLVIPDLIAGQVAFLMDSIVSAQSHIKDGRIRALAVSGATRSSSLPSVPTFTEIGIPNMTISNWFGVFAPAGTSDAIVNKLNAEINTISKSPDMIERLEKLGAETMTSTPVQFATTYRIEADSWKAVIKRANIKAE
jgi:tripartite-type tricarboxylate transporter receptor subunit TctC